MQPTDTGSGEDWRAAANIAVSLSEYLITVALAVIGGQLGFATVLVDKRRKLLPYYCISLLALTLLVGSVVYGGWAVRDVYHYGFKGQWINNTAAAHNFNLQAILLLSGFIAALISVPVALAVGKPIINTEADSSGPATKVQTPAMRIKRHLIITSLIFLVIGLLHLLRIVFGWQATIGSLAIPMWVSWVAVPVAGYFAYEALRLNRYL